MDLRTKQTFDRKNQEAKQKKNEAAEKRRQAQVKKDAARAKQREEELYDKKAEEATKHADKLKRERDSRVDRIRGYHRHIDGCTQEMRECEQMILDVRARIPGQQDMIRTRRAEKKKREDEAMRLRAEADSAAILGQSGMQLHGMRNNSRRLLEEAERKIREAKTKERAAADLESLALEGERNIHRLCDQKLVYGRQRADVQNERKLEEDRVAKMAESLERYKREMANCLTAARNLRLEEARMGKEACEKKEQAEKLEREASALDEEAAKLESEARQNGQGGW